MLEILIKPSVAMANRQYWARGTAVRHTTVPISHNIRLILQSVVHTTNDSLSYYATYYLSPG